MNIFFTGGGRALAHSKGLIRDGRIVEPLRGELAFDSNGNLFLGVEGTDGLMWVLLSRYDQIRELQEENKKLIELVKLMASAMLSKNADDMIAVENAASSFGLKLPAEGNK
jgi:hypothetical protein